MGKIRFISTAKVLENLQEPSQHPLPQRMHQRRTKTIAKHQNVPEERADHTSIQHGSLHHTLNSVGGHLPDIHLGGDFEADVGSSTVPTTTALPPTSHVNRLYYRRPKNAWVREHKSTKYARHADKPKIHDLAMERKRVAMPVEIHQEAVVQGKS